MCDSVAQLRTNDDEERCLKENKRDSPLLTTAQHNQPSARHYRWGEVGTNHLKLGDYWGGRHWGKGGGLIWWDMVATRSRWSFIRLNILTLVGQCMDTPRLKHSAKCLTGGSKSSVSDCQDIYFFWLFHPCSGNSLEKIQTLIRVSFWIISFLIRQLTTQVYVCSSVKDNAFQLRQIWWFSLCCIKTTKNISVGKSSKL